MSDFATTLSSVHRHDTRDAPLYWLLRGSHLMRHMHRIDELRAGSSAHKIAVAVNYFLLPKFSNHQLHSSVIQHPYCNALASQTFLFYLACAHVLQEMEGKMTFCETARVWVC